MFGFGLRYSICLMTTALMPLAAQSTGRIAGTLLDPEESLVVSARVLCQNASTGLRYEGLSNEEGLFRFAELPIGDYYVMVTSPDPEDDGAQGHRTSHSPNRGACHEARNWPGQRIGAGDGCGDDDVFDVRGLIVPRRHPAILFGDGGTCKSYLALYVAGRLAEQDFTTALFDWALVSKIIVTASSGFFLMECRGYFTQSASGPWYTKPIA